MADDKERTPTPLLAGRYVLGEPFASGGMGTVHLGRVVGASGFSRVVAIKRLFPGFATDSSFRQMLVDEARFASRIRQPNVVPILDVVEAERDLYVVMEYVHGLPLGTILSATPAPPPMPVEVAVAIAEAILFGLHAAHEARDEDGTPLGIVHRDVSPQNVMVGADGVPRLIDFGIAKAATRIQVTDPGVIKGKAGYMAPEQLLYEPVARHADVFSASVVLWEMLAGRRLFPFDVSERVRRAAERVVPPSAHRPGIAATLDAVVLRGLERDPARRFPTAEAMALELRRDHTVASAVEVTRWLAATAPDELEISEERVRLFEQTPSVRPASLPSPVPLVTAPATVSTIPDAWTPEEEKPKPKRGWLFAIGAATAAVLALVAFKLAPHHAEAAVASPPLAEVATTVPPSPVPVAPPPASVAVAAPSAASAPLPSVASAAASKAPPSHARHGAAAASGGGAKAKCDPPYTIDAEGFKHYDQRCF